MNSDQKLITDYLRGDEKSLEILIRRYLKPIYSFVYRYVGDEQETEDITQEVFVKMWRNLKKFDKNKKFQTWIFSIAKNASLGFLKKKKTTPFSSFENEEGENPLPEIVADSAPLPDKLFERADVEEMLNTAMKQLVPQYRIVLFLRYNDHFTFREIAETLGEPLHTVKSRHRRAIVRLKKLLSQS